MKKKTLRNQADGVIDLEAMWRSFLLGYLMSAASNVPGASLRLGATDENPLDTFRCIVSTRDGGDFLVTIEPFEE